MVKLIPASKSLLEGAQQLVQHARAAGEKSYPEAEYDLSFACYLVAHVFERTRAYDQALPLLDEAQKRMENFERKDPGRGAERMALICRSEQGDCLCNLGRLDQAAAIYKESMRRAEKVSDARGVAIVKCQLGIVRRRQGRSGDALKAFGESRELFVRLNEQGMVATTWHEIGNVYFDTRQSEAAEDAYRKSLQISVCIGDVTLQANTLTQLGNLHGALLGRFEEAVEFYRRAADKFVEIGDAANESRAKGNLATNLRRLGRLDEARHEIRRAIECGAPFGHATEPWMNWNILYEIESDAGDAAAAAEAKREAIALYVTYRRDGGQFEYSSIISLDVIRHLLDGNLAAAASLLPEIDAYPELSGSTRAFVQALKAIVAGSRDRTLANHPELLYRMAGEILFLLETLEKLQRPPTDG
jgi:tetratricopeptide (TPR) repeat protein